jgi:integrase
MRGGVTKRAGKNGVSYYPRITFRDPVTGESKRMRLPAQPTRRAAEESITKALHELRTGAYLEASTEPLRSFLKRWLDAVAPSLGDSTVYSYGMVIRNRIVPELGNVPLGKLTARSIQELLARQLERGYKPSTVQQTHSVLRAALAQAVEWREVPRNVAADVRAPRNDEPEREAWTVEEIRRFLATAADDPYGPLWRLALDTGMRLGELLALRWSDVDLKAEMVTVRRTVTRSLTGGWKIGDAPKTNRGRRMIAIASSTVALLQRHRAAQDARRKALGSDWHDLDLVFDRRDGGLASEWTVQQAFARAIEKAQVRRITFHQLRHTNATLLGEILPPRLLQDRLGHATLAMTMKYSHVTANMARTAARHVETLLNETTEHVGDKIGTTAWDDDRKLA